MFPCFHRPCHFFFPCFSFLSFSFSLFLAKRRAAVGFSSDQGSNLQPLRWKFRVWNCWAAREPHSCQAHAAPATCVHLARPCGSWVCDSYGLECIKENITMVASCISCTNQLPVLDSTILLENAELLHVFSCIFCPMWFCKLTVFASFHGVNILTMAESIQC